MQYNLNLEKTEKGIYFLPEKGNIGKSNETPDNIGNLKEKTISSWCQVIGGKEGEKLKPIFCKKDRSNLTGIHAGFRCFRGMLLVSCKNSESGLNIIIDRIINIEISEEKGIATMKRINTFCSNAWERPLFDNLLGIVSYAKEKLEKTEIEVYANFDK